MLRNSQIIQYVVDSSVVIKWILQKEILAEYALAIRDALLEEKIMLFAPTLSLYEIANVLRYKSEFRVEQVKYAIYSIFDVGVNWIQPDKEIQMRAISISREFEISLYDGSFVALAEMYQTQLITADEKLIEKVKSLGFVRYLMEINL